MEYRFDAIKIMPKALSTGRQVKDQLSDRLTTRTTAVVSESMIRRTNKGKNERLINRPTRLNEQTNGRMSKCCDELIGK